MPRRLRWPLAHLFDAVVPTSPLELCFQLAPRNLPHHAPRHLPRHLQRPRTGLRPRPRPDCKTKSSGHRRGSGKTTIDNKLVVESHGTGDD